MYCNLFCITETRETSSRERQLMQRMTQTYIPACREEQCLCQRTEPAKICNKAAGNKKKVGRIIETKAKPSDQRIELQARKEERTG